jgi:hypothetical protein
MPTNMVIAFTLSMKKVNGRVNVINIVAVKPGMDPMMMPDATPINRKNSGKG